MKSILAIGIGAVLILGLLAAREGRYIGRDLLGLKTT